MQSGYHQLVMDPDSIELTAFCTPSGLIVYMVVTPQGACVEPGAFRRIMFRVTDGLPNCQVYVDDDVIYDLNPKGHVAYLATCFGRFEEHNLNNSPSESQIGATTIIFLGTALPQRAAARLSTTFQLLWTCQCPKMSLKCACCWAA
ncbi:unnamed protein product [Sphacelaria rigidula]